MGDLIREPDEKTVYDRIKQLLISYSIFPGDRLHVLELADQLRVSATPVREALNRFWAEGLLTAVPHRGFFVKKLDQAEMADLYAMKHMILTYAASGSLAALQLEKAEHQALTALAALGDNGGDGDRASSIATYERFAIPMTMLVGSMAGNVALVACLNNVLDKLHFVRFTEIRMEDRVAAVLCEAASLAQALLASDEEQVRRCLDRQFDRELSMLESLMKECINRLYLRGRPVSTPQGGELRKRRRVLSM